MFIVIMFSRVLRLIMQQAIIKQAKVQLLSSL